MNGEPVSEVMIRGTRWSMRYPVAPRFATARQVHGTRVVVHSGAWEGWLRLADADGHAAPERGTATAVSIADCVPIFIVHPSGATALLHSGWRGTAAGILDHGVTALAHRGFVSTDLRVHLGPAISESYEVSPMSIANYRKRVHEPRRSTSFALADRARTRASAVSPRAPGARVP